MPDYDAIEREWQWAERLGFTQGWVPETSLLATFKEQREMKAQERSTAERIAAARFPKRNGTPQAVETR
jgi:hypothetical protein